MRKVVQAFTLMELIVVAVVVGLVAAFAIPNYSKAVDKALARDMVNNLRVIAAAQESYLAGSGTGNYYPAGGGNSTRAQLNQNLGLNIISQKGVVYSCSITVPQSTGSCDAAYPGRFTYRISTSPAIIPPWTQITCSSGVCPAGVP